VQTYNYVGEGAGSFDKRESYYTAYGWQLRGCCAFITAILLLVLAIWLLPPLFRNHFQESYVNIHHHIQHSGTIFDCDSGFSHWMQKWSPKHKAWCCRNYGKGCDPAKAPYDCEVGYHHWATSWNEGKKFWCCKYYGRGCPATSTSQKYDCDAGFANWQRGWSIGKKRWCCQFFHKGCPSTTRFNACNNKCWLHGESATCEKRIQFSAKHHYGGRPAACDLAYRHVKHECSACHACERDRVPCVTPPTTARTTSLPYDCQAGLSNWENGWSIRKKAWCCDHQKLGCNTVTTIPTIPPTPPPVLRGCDTQCTTGGQNLACGERIRIAAKTSFGGRDNACVSAYSAVLQECTMCSVCSIVAARCVDRRTATARATLALPPAPEARGLDAATEVAAVPKSNSTTTM
jgi:hypothetical protein